MLFMTSMDMIWDNFLFKHPKKLFIHDSSWFQAFFRLWVSLIQASPNYVRSFTNCWVLSPNSPNVYRKSIKDNLNPINLSLSLILNLPLDQSPCFNTENNKSHKKTSSNLIFGYDFDSTGTIWMYHDFVNVLETKFKSKEVNIMLSNEFPLKI